MGGPNVTWKRHEDGAHNTYHVAIHEGRAVAAVWFIGGHVERPDAWHVTWREGMPGHGDCAGSDTLGEMKQWVEEMIRDWAEKRVSPPSHPPCKSSPRRTGSPGPDRPSGSRRGTPRPRAA